MGTEAVRAQLERHGLAANRELGQNFLIDPKIADRLVEIAGVTSQDCVIEIGPGLGALTAALARRARRVIALEVDAGLVRALREDATLPAHVELHHADALRFDLGALARGEQGPVRLVANLPYSISGPLLRRLLDLRDQLVDWSVMIQREVGARLLAEQNTRDYGSLAVLHRLSARLERGMDLKPGCFFPVPRVRSSFVRVVPLAAPLLAADELAWVERVLRAAFGQRRKTIANALRSLADGAGATGAGSGSNMQERIAAALRETGVDSRSRAEQLAPETLLAVARALRDRTPAGASEQPA